MGQKRSAAHTRAQKAGRERDGNVCQICGSMDHVEGHHLIDYQYGGGANVDNIISLCKECHHAVHRGLIDLITF